MVYHVTRRCRSVSLIVAYHPFATPTYTLSSDMARHGEHRLKLIHRPIPVAASRDLRQHPTLIIRRGTPGEVMNTTGFYYTVMFWPFGPKGATVTIPNLSRADLTAA